MHKHIPARLVWHMVMDSWVCGLAVVVFSVSGSKNSRVDTGLPDTSGDIWKGISISHCRDSNALESRHPPTSSRCTVNFRIQGGLRCQLQGNRSLRSWSEPICVPESSIGSIPWWVVTSKLPYKFTLDPSIWGKHSSSYLVKFPSLPLWHHSRAIKGCFHIWLNFLGSHNDCFSQYLVGPFNQVAVMSDSWNPQDAVVHVFQSSDQGQGKFGFIIKQEVIGVV